MQHAGNEGNYYIALCGRGAAHAIDGFVAARDGVTGRALARVLTSRCLQAMPDEALGVPTAAAALLTALLAPEVRGAT
jgi:hypothetical protein